MFSWKYRVRDCDKKIQYFVDNIDEVNEHANLDKFLVDLLKSGESISDGKRWKVDVRGKWSDKTWKM